MIDTDYGYVSVYALSEPSSKNVFRPLIIQLNEFADMNNLLLTPKGIVPTEIYNLPETEPSKEKL